MEAQTLENMFGAYSLEVEGGLISDEEEELLPFPRSYNTKFKDWLEAENPNECKIEDDTKEDSKIKSITENLAHFKMLSSSSSDQTMGLDLSRSLSSTKSIWSSGSENSRTNRQSSNTSSSEKSSKSGMGSPLTTDSSSSGEWQGRMDRLIRKRKSLETTSDDAVKSLRQINEREEEEKEEKYQSPAKSDFMDKCNLN